MLDKLKNLFKKKYIIETQSGKHLGIEYKESAASIYALQMSEVNPTERIVIRRDEKILATIIGPQSLEAELANTPRGLSIMDCREARKFLYKIMERDLKYVEEDVVDAIKCLDSLIMALSVKKEHG